MSPMYVIEKVLSGPRAEELELDTEILDIRRSRRIPLPQSSMKSYVRPG